MTDVLRIALERRDHLQSEIERLDEFIRMAEMLMRSSQARQEADEDEDEPATRPRVNVLRRGFANAG